MAAQSPSMYPNTSTSEIFRKTSRKGTQNPSIPLPSKGTCVKVNVGVVGVALLATGVALAIEEKPDLILMVMGLPDIDGQTVVTLLKQIPEMKDVPIVAVTAWPADTAEKMAQRYGCDGCITKPINIKTFPDQIAEYLK